MFCGLEKHEYAARIVVRSASCLHRLVRHVSLIKTVNIVICDETGLRS